MSFLVGSPGPGTVAMTCFVCNRTLADACVDGTVVAYLVCAMNLTLFGVQRPSAR